MCTRRSLGHHLLHPLIQIPNAFPELHHYETPCINAIVSSSVVSDVLISKENSFLYIPKFVEGKQYSFFGAVMLPAMQCFV